MNTRTQRLLTAVLLVLFTVVPVLSGLIEERVETVQDGMVCVTYPCREGIVGDGETIIQINRGGKIAGHLDPGPVRVELCVLEGRVVEIDLLVGGKWPEKKRDVVTVSGPEAARYFLSLADRAKELVAEDAVFASTLAEGCEVWPGLLKIARERSRPMGVREAALFWLGGECGERIEDELEKIVNDDDEDLQMREEAIFVLADREKGESLPVLLRIARSSRHPQLRQEAIFWLSQIDDPRVVSLFEEILLGG